MNDKTGGKRGLRRAGALAVMAAVAVLATGCGVHISFGNGSASTGSYTFAQELALAQCMRGHGVPNFPDPDPSGGFNASVLSTIDNSQVRAAYGACRHLLPGGGPSFTRLQQEAQQEQQEEQKELPVLLKFAQCMRSHGVPNFPDPPLGGQSTPAPSKGAGIDPNSPQFQAAVNACQHVLPAGAQLHVSVRGSAQAP
jgi:hypothetical protein